MAKHRGTRHGVDQLSDRHESRRRSEPGAGALQSDRQVHRHAVGDRSRPGHEAGDAPDRAETLGVPIEDVYVDTADSDTGPHDMGSFASRGTHRVGNAVMVAAKEARGVMMEAAAEELEVNAADLETDGRGNIHVKGAPHRADLGQGRRHRRAVQAGQDHRRARHLPGPAVGGDPETGEMSPVHLLRACLPRRRGGGRRRDRRSHDAQDDQAYELGRAINPKMVEQQLVGGAWMGMSHALYETPEPYYPDPSHGPRDFNEYLMPGPGDICPHDIAVLERPAPDGPFGGKGPGEMCANPVLPGGRQRDLQCGRRAHRRIADHAREGAARAARRSGGGAKPQREDGGRPWRRARQSRRHRQPARRWSTRCAPRFYLADEGLATAAYLALALGKPLLLEGAPGVGKTEAAKAIAGVLGAAADPAAVLRGHRCRDRAL